MRRMHEISEKELKQLKKITELGERYVQTTKADFIFDSEDDCYVYDNDYEFIILPPDLEYVDQDGSFSDNYFPSVLGVASLYNRLKNGNYMFAYFDGLYLELSFLKTSNVTDMNGMFQDSQALELDLSSFDTSNVTDMRGMFQDSQALELDLSSFDTSNVTNMRGMFQRSKALELDLSSFDTSNVTDMSDMFSNSKALELDLSGFTFKTGPNVVVANMFSNALTKKVFVKDLASKTFLETNATNTPVGLEFIVKE